MRQWVKSYLNQLSGSAPFSISVEPPALASDVLRRIDNEISLEYIYFDIAMEHPGLPWPLFLDQFEELYMALNGLLNGLFLR
jgi:hypothetical protein